MSGTSSLPEASIEHAREPGTEALRIERLEKSFGSVRALQGIDLTVQEGEFVTLLGPSGCGKSTTLRIVAGLEQATAGRVSLFGRVVADASAGTSVPPNRRPIGMVFQSYALWPHMSALKNVMFPLQNGRHPEGGGEARKLSTSDARELAMNALELVKCAHLRDRFPGEMSGGQQQRVALARSLVHSPPMVLLDEPLSNLDAWLRRELRVELRRMQQDIGFTALYVTHDQAEALAMSDRVVLMNEGVIEQVATPKDLFEQPATTYAARFIGDHNLLEGSVVTVDPTGLATVETVVGAVPARPPQGGVPPSVSTRATVAVRSDRLRITTVEASDASGRVHGSAYNGAYVDIVVEAPDGRRVTVRDYTGATPPGVNSPVALEFLSPGILVQADPA